LKIAKNNIGELISIADALENQEYYCVDCNNKLIKKNKNLETRKREIHFAHHIPCTGNLETYLHAVSKLIIENEGRILLPKLGFVSFDQSKVETKLEDIFPDILITDKKSTPIIIEIYVTHLTDQIKIDKIKRLKISAFEINLSKLSYDSDFKIIRFEVIENLNNRKRLDEFENVGNDDNSGFICVVVAFVLVFLLYRFYPRKIPRNR
jgi:hypothetical protein